ncbi:MAG: hypothetical protein A2622_04500 [Bdellovibrionales bacterium RIFCSPHIGHO2_01_FULL_40_29]|nr:MAG: hypothetical protein A2622_04500 [Bdellovibrionales bacterium RIFCSPHIGHO2_01_FULL_40_29]OFZ34805.1 MAG: hypothetical protein A3D17_10875 [Bdellovibrionales bacterium RIFCSPHIGHO2_02_FULL_40_15]
MRWSSLKLSLLVVLSFSMSLILSSFLFYKNLNILLGFWNKENRISIYLKAEALDTDKKEILDILKLESALTDIQFTDRDKATQDFTKMFGQYSAGMISVDDLVDLVPESYSAKVPLNLDETELNRIKEKIMAHALVEEISYGGEWFKKFSKLDRALKIFGLTLFLVLSLAVTFISALMVRSLVDESKSEIEVLSLIGATRWHIYEKYLRQFLYFFVLSIGVSVGLCALAFVLIKSKFLSGQGLQFISENLQFLNWGEISMILGLLFVFVMAGASLSLRSTIQRLSLFSYE